MSDASRGRTSSYEAALASYVEGRFADAAARLESLAREAADPAAERLLELCRRYEVEPPPPGWDGVTRYDAE